MMDLRLGDTPTILRVCQQHKLTIPQTAYVLATAYKETAFSMKPVREAYYLGEPKAENYRKTLRYYPWYGRGYVQLTWEDNYDKADHKLELGGKLVADPDLALDENIAAEVIVVGMSEGWFTGVDLFDYINGAKKDYVNARRIVNGTDCAKEIAGYAQAYEDTLDPYPLLKKGSAGQAVLRAQRLLEKNGFSPKGNDGIFGNNTYVATRSFQGANGLDDDGIIGDLTWAKLRERERG